MMTRCCQFAAFACCLLIAAGCGVSTPTAAEPPADLPVAAKPALVKPQVPDAEPTAAFQPPFPSRTDPFARPKIDAAARQTAVAGADVKLKGFVDSDNLTRALVSIDGHPAMLSAGEEKNGIRVLEISPPEVILERGRQRWTARLFE